MKNALITILIVAVIVLGAVVYMQMQKLNALTDDVAKLKESAESNIVSVNNNAEKANSDVGDDETESVSTSKKKVEFDPDKLKNGGDGIYEEEDSENWVINNLGIEVTVKNGKAYITKDSSKDDNKLFEDCKDVENQEITGFKAKPETYFLAFQGHDIVDPTICFLMDDGTVEYVKSLKMLKNETYESEGKIKGLENIIGFKYVSVSDPDGMGGYVSTVAIDEDGYAYDIYEMI